MCTSQGLCTAPVRLRWPGVDTIHCCCCCCASHMHVTRHVHCASAPPLAWCRYYSLLLLLLCVAYARHKACALRHCVSRWLGEDILCCDVVGSQGALHHALGISISVCVCQHTVVHLADCLSTEKPAHLHAQHRPLCCTHFIVSFAVVSGACTGCCVRCTFITWWRLSVCQ
jgi:hypothetical protein